MTKSSLLNESEQLSMFNQKGKKSAKRVNIVSLKLVKESSLLYKERSVRSPEDGYLLFNI